MDRPDRERVKDVAVNKRFGDRRLTPRFDIVGELWGTLEAIVRFQVDNIGPGGVLFYSHVALPPDSVHQLTVSGGQREFTTRSTRRSPGSDSARPRTRRTSASRHP